MAKKGHFLTRHREKNGPPTLHENRIRGLENVSTDLKIGIHVPWGSRKKLPIRFWIFGFFPILGGLKVEKCQFLAKIAQIGS